MTHRFDQMDIEFDRGFPFEINIPVFEEGDYTPLEDVKSWHAIIVEADRIDAEVIVALNTEVADDEDTTIRISATANTTQSFDPANAFNPAGYWFFYYIDQNDVMVPIKRGKVTVR